MPKNKKINQEADEVIKILDSIANERNPKSSPETQTKLKDNSRQKKKVTAKQTQDSVKKVKPSLVDKTKLYELKEGIELLKKISKTKFNSSLELHLNTTEKGIKMNVSLPHGTGKQIRVAVVSDELLLSIDKGILDFDVLIAHPSYMPKLAKYAKVLGPKGLMPNPKNGTVTTNIEKTVADFSKGQVQVKTESDFPLIHLLIGKLDMKTEDLCENVTTAIEAVKKNKIKTAYLCSTMSPSVKIDLEKI